MGRSRPCCAELQRRDAFQRRRWSKTVLGKKTCRKKKKPRLGLERQVGKRVRFLAQVLPRKSARFRGRKRRLVNEPNPAGQVGNPRVFCRVPRKRPRKLARFLGPISGRRMTFRNEPHCHRKISRKRCQKSAHEVVQFFFSTTARVRSRSVSTSVVTDTSHRRRGHVVVKASGCGTQVRSQTFRGLRGHQRLGDPGSVLLARCGSVGDTQAAIGNVKHTIKHTRRCDKGISGICEADYLTRICSMRQTPHLQRGTSVSAWLRWPGTRSLRRTGSTSHRGRLAHM